MDASHCRRRAGNLTAEPQRAISSPFTSDRRDHGDMSIPVAIEELQAATSRYQFAYLLTVSDDGRSHAVAVHPSWTDDGVMLIAEAGRRTSANAAARPNISLVWPPVTVEDYSLIVDGNASIAESGLTFTPTNAVLHRPAPAGSPSGSGCGSDCVPIGLVGTHTH